jgi:tetratricopeptide (TPR) repeat protein
MVGMTLELVPEKGIDADAELLDRNLREVYFYRGVNDESVYKDVNTSRLLGNYRACVMTLAEVYKNEGRTEDLASLFGWASETIPMSWEGFYQASEYYWDAGQHEESAEYLEKAGLQLLKVYGSHPSASYENGLAIGSILFSRYLDIERAGNVYRMAIEREPSRYEAYHELAAALQAAGETDSALDLVVAYRDEFGDHEAAITDEQILRTAQSQATPPLEADSVSAPADSPVGDD